MVQTGISKANRVKNDKNRDRDKTFFIFSVLHPGTAFACYLVRKKFQLRKNRLPCSLALLRKKWRRTAEQCKGSYEKSLASVGEGGSHHDYKRRGNKTTCSRQSSLVAKTLSTYAAVETGNSTTFTAPSI